MQHLMTALAALISAACAAAIGVLFTVAHRASVEVAGFEFPYGIILGIACSVAFLTAMRLLWDSRWPAVGGAIALIATILVLSLNGLGGSVVVGDDAYGWTWLVVVPIAAIVVVAWPRMPRRRHAARRGVSQTGDTIGGSEQPAKEYP